MRTRWFLSIALVMALTPRVAPYAQAAPPKTKTAKSVGDTGAKKDKKPKVGKSATDSGAKRLPDAPMFKSDSLLNVTFTMNIGRLRNDRGDNAPYRAATVSYADTSAPGGKRVIPTRVRTHGVWRLKNCEFPPIRINFVNKDTKGSLFHDLDEPKVTNFCKNTSSYEQYILQEFQLYRVYRLLTPYSHRVRLLRATYVDSSKNKVEGTHYAFIIEDPQHVMASNGGGLLKQKGAGPDDLDPTGASLAYLFEYFIGNTDFSFNGLHNGEILALPDGRNIPIAYDFDFAGAVEATYAVPDPSLPINRVRQRLFRGFCAQNAEVHKLLPLFQEKKAAIYALYTDPIGALMSPRTVKETLSYFDEFYKTISNPKELASTLKDCRK